MNADAESKPLLDFDSIFTLGNVDFFVSNCDESYEADLIKLLPLSQKTSRDDGYVWQLKTGCNRDVSSVISGAAMLQQNAIWMWGGVLLTESGQLVLLSSHGGTGCNAIALALSSKFNWRIVCQQFAILNAYTGYVIPFFAPMSFESAEIPFLEKFVSKMPEELIRVTWSPKRKVYWTACVKQASEQLAEHFKHVLHLAIDDDLHETTKISSMVMLKKLFANSNALAQPRGSDTLYSKIENAQCFDISARSEFELLEKVIEVAPQCV